MKDNQKNLSKAIADFFDTAVAFDFHNIDVQKRSSIEKNHGRIETRRAVFVRDVSWMDKPMREGWKKLSAVGMIESEQEIKGKVTIADLLGSGRQRQFWPSSTQPSGSARGQLYDQEAAIALENIIRPVRVGGCRSGSRD